MSRMINWFATAATYRMKEDKSRQRLLVSINFSEDDKYNHVLEKSSNMLVVVKVQCLDWFWSYNYFMCQGAMFRLVLVI